MKHIEKTYPFQEGERYFTIEGNTIVESVWDDQSEELHTPLKMYFNTALEAFYYYRFIKTDEMLTSAVQFISKPNKTDDEIAEFLESYNYFNTNPKFSLL